MNAERDRSDMKLYSKFWKGYGFTHDLQTLRSIALKKHGPLGVLEHFLIREEKKYRNVFGNERHGEFEGFTCVHFLERGED